MLAIPVPIRELENAMELVMKNIPTRRGFNLPAQ
jgi:hypothetical protein